MSRISGDVKTDVFYTHQWQDAGPIEARVFSRTPRGTFIWRRPIDPATRKWAGPWRLSR